MNKEQFDVIATRFTDYCRKELNFGIGDMQYYSCLPLCALDAVFSIGVRYTSVSNTVDRFCESSGIIRSAQPSNRIPPIDGQLTVSQVEEKLKGITPEGLAARIGNRQRTSSRNGILKTAAFTQWLDILSLHEIQTYQDFHRKFNDCNLERDLRAVRGQGSGIAVNYFYMLAGNTNDVKVDRHITAFSCAATGVENLSPSTIKDLFKAAVKELKKDYPCLTVRHLDHIVWEYQRTKNKFNHYLI